MIVKIKNGKDSWSYFECEIVHSKYDYLHNVKSLSEAVMLFEEVLSEPKQVKVLNLESQKSHLRTVITDRVVYVLNDQGKTIDKI